MEMLTISHVSKAFGGNQVISDLNLSVPEHCIYGFIGENGAGKTTTMRMVLGLLPPDSGEIHVNGIPVSFGQNNTNRFIGYLPDVPEYYDYMTPAEYLRLCGCVTGMEKTDIAARTTELLSLVGLDGADRRIRGFSRGMRQRLGIAQALLHRPRLLICDEPTSALDPAGRKEILDILAAVKEETTVIFSTHILSDVERICDQVALLHKGRVELQGTMEEIRCIRQGSGVEIEFLRPEDTMEFEKLYAGGKKNGDVRLIYEKKTSGDMSQIFELLARHRIPVQRVEMLDPTLEDLFLEVIGK